MILKNNKLMHLMDESEQGQSFSRDQIGQILQLGKHVNEWCNQTQYNTCKVCKFHHLQGKMTSLKQIENLFFSSVALTNTTDSEEKIQHCKH